MRQLALALVVACGSPHHAPPDAMPVQLDLDVVVNHDGVFVYPNASDRGGASCPGAQFYFPRLGQDVVWDDTFTCTPNNATCLESLSVVANGVTHSLFSSSLSAYVDVTTAPDATLTVEGCGGSATFAIGGVAPITATLTASNDTAAESITATWSAPAEATSALLEFNAGYWAHVVRVADHQYTFVPPEQTITPYHFVSASALREPTIVPTVFGDVRVWSTDRIMVQPQ